MAATRDVEWIDAPGGGLDPHRAYVEPTSKTLAQRWPSVDRESRDLDQVDATGGD